MITKDFIDQTRQKVANDRIPEAIQDLSSVLQNSPLLNDILLQSARHKDIARQINLGIASFEDASLTKNKISLAILDLISEIETQETQPKIRQELEKAISVVNSRNVVVAPITTSGDVHVGDYNQQTIHTESQTSKRVRLFLFVFVPVIAIGGAWFWYQYQEMKRPLTLKVFLDNTTSNRFLPEPVGSLTLTYGGNPITKDSVTDEVLFEEIPASYKNQKLRLQFQEVGVGFESVDTTLEYQEAVRIKVRRNQNLALFRGHIYQEVDGKEIPVEGAGVSIDCCETITSASGNFTIEIPFSDQQYQQQVRIYKEGFEPVNTKTPIDSKSTFRQVLIPD